MFSLLVFKQNMTNHVYSFKKKKKQNNSFNCFTRKASNTWI